MVDLYTYASETEVTASYKLVILYLLVSSSNGELPLSTCAMRFHAFYLSMVSLGVPAERGTAVPPIRMASPLDITPNEVQALLRKEPNRSFRRNELVVLQDDRLYIERTTWNACAASVRQEVLHRLRERLESYFKRHLDTAAYVPIALEHALQAVPNPKSA